jgi:ADP-ribose pyrophosphatase YjhB (NUDIX family)
VKTFVIVVGFVACGDQILVVRRADDRKHSPGLWEPIGGFVRRYESIEAAMVRKVVEVTGLEVGLAAAGPAFECEDAGAWWVVKPYLLEPVADPAPIALTAYHCGHRWVTPDEVLALDCVDGMREDLEALGLLEPSVAV